MPCPTYPLPCAVVTPRRCRKSRNPGGTPLHPAVAEEFLHRHPLLSAGFLHHEIQPAVCHRLASLPGLLACHPLAPEGISQGFLACLHELQEMLREVTGMQAVSLTPMAGAQGEFAGMAMIRAYHVSRRSRPSRGTGTGRRSRHQSRHRHHVRFHGSGNSTDAAGDVDLAALRQAVGPQTAGLMLTNPSTLGVFERNIAEIAAIVHQAGGLLYYDGANLNAILGKARPGDMGFDVMHMNLHKTFATPHGGGGPGAGPVAANARLAPFLPIPIVGKEGERYRWLNEADRPQSIGRLSAFMGNAGVILRAYVYARLLGRAGMGRVAEFSTLNANYLLAELMKTGFDAAFPNDGPATNSSSLSSGRPRRWA